MTLYDLIQQVSDIITPETGTFYHYVLHTSDDNGGFLRTRYCWWEEPVENFEMGDEPYDKVLITTERPIDIKDLENREKTLVKMQFSYGDFDLAITNLDWDWELGYSFAYVFDLKNKTYTYERIPSPYDELLNRKNHD